MAPHYDASVRRVTSRRQFLTRAAAALAGVGATGRIALGMDNRMSETWCPIPQTPHARRLPYRAWLPEAPPDEYFRTLALVAMDAAKQAGADFADIRIGVQRECQTYSTARVALGYGIRARVAGTWSFEHGTVLTPDAIAAVARSAVIGARTASAINIKIGYQAHEPLASAPVARGTWATPIQVDPFSVPLDDYIRVEDSYRDSLKHLGHVVGRVELGWTVETRIFASTEGSLVTQTFTRGGPRVDVRAWLPDDPLDAVVLGVGRWDGESTGFEAAFQSDLIDRIVAAGEEAIRWRELPIRSFDDVGRYPMVFDGAAFAGLVGHTLNFALDGDRLSGNESDASGRSFLQPLSQHPALSPPEFSSLLTVSSDRVVPSSMAVQWDDEGVVPMPFTLVDKGTVVDFQTTRDTMPKLEPWYRQRHRTGQLHGGCLAPAPTSLPLQTSGELHVASGSSGSTPLELAREMSHGFLVKGVFVYPAPGLTTGFFVSPLIVEIRNGKPVARIKNVRMGFITNVALRAGLVALGNEKTVDAAIASTQKGLPWQAMSHPVTAPAALCKEIDVYRANMSR